MFELLPHEQPTDDVIEDDDALDAWWTNFWNTKKREMARQMGQKQGTPVDFSKLPMFKE